MSMIAVTVTSPDLDAGLEPRFGRAPHVVLVDPETMEWEALDNPAWQASGGAGVQAAQLLSERKVSAVVSGEFGPNAHAALEAAGIVMHRCREAVTAREAVERVKRGETAAPVEAEVGGAGASEAAGPAKAGGALGQVVTGVVGGLMAGRRPGRGGGQGRGGRGGG
ncbi:MAG: NifB/NifX family molybdenum-iron cluster-binding protein, partial [Gemmatimonadota bacterium]